MRKKKRRNRRKRNLDSPICKFRDSGWGSNSHMLPHPLDPTLPVCGISLLSWFLLSLLGVSSAPEHDWERFSAQAPSDIQNIIYGPYSTGRHTGSP